MKRTVLKLCAVACCLPTAAIAQTNVWDSILSNTNWYVPIPNLIAYMTGSQSFTTPPPLAIGDQTLWAWGAVVDGVISGTSNASFSLGSTIVPTSPLLINGKVTNSGQIVLEFTPEGGGTTTLGIGQMRMVGSVPLAEMQMITGSGSLIAHWAYMAPYNPATFTPPSPTQVITANVTSPQWNWSSGTTWQIVSPTLFGTSTPGTFKIGTYNNGYFWGLGAGPTGGLIGNFTQMGSITPEGNVLFAVLNDGTLITLTGLITGDSSTGMMALKPYDLSGPYGTASIATLMPVSNINSGMTYFASDLGTVVNPVFAGGTLQIDTVGSTYAQNFTLDASGSNTIDQRGRPATFSGNFADAVPGTPGSLTIANSEMLGSITFTGDSSYTGLTTVEPGATFIVNGSIASPVTVDGTLGGSGTVGPLTVNSGGVLGPGNSIGTLTVAGNASFAAGSTYLVEVAGAAADRTNVTGAATLSGGTVLASFEPGSYVRRYTILSAAGGRTGTFDQLNALNLPVGLSASLAYTPTDVQLGLTAIVGSGATLTGNQAGVAATINTAFNSGGNVPAGLQGVFSLSGASLSSTLNGLTGEAQAGVQATAFTFGTQFLDMVNASAGGGSADPQQALQYASTAATETVGESRRFRSWAAGFGGYGWLGGSTAAGSTAVQTSTQGVAVGTEWSFEGGLLGFAVAGGTTGWSLEGGLGNGRGSAFQGGLYGRTTVGPVYISAAGSWGQQTISTQRSVPFLGDSLTANYTTSLWSARLETGHRFTVGDLGLVPFVAGQGQWLAVPGFCESSARNSGANLCFAGSTSSSIRSELGVEADADMGSVLGSPAKLRARLGWAHEYETTGQIAAWFPAMSGSAFPVVGASLPRDLGFVRVVSDFALDDRWSLRLQGDGAFADNYAGLAGTIRLSARW